MLCDCVCVCVWGGGGGGGRERENKGSRRSGKKEVSDKGGKVSDRDIMI